MEVRCEGYPGVDDSPNCLMTPAPRARLAAGNDSANGGVATSGAVASVERALTRPREHAGDMARLLIAQCALSAAL